MNFEHVTFGLLLKNFNRVPYSNHSVRLSFCSSVLLSVRQKTLTLAITFLPLEKGLLYLACVILMTRPFQRYHEF